MRTIRKETLSILYQRSNKMLVSIYVLLVFVIVFTSNHKIPVFSISVSIPLLIVCIQYTKQKWHINIDEFILPIIILAIFYFDYSPSFSEPFWLFYFLIIYRIILFVGNYRYKIFLLVCILILVSIAPINSNADINSILIRLVSLTVFATITFIGFEYLLNYQDQLLQTIKSKNEVEQKLLKYKKDLEEAQRIALLGGWEYDLINNNIFWSKEVYDIHEKEYSYVPNMKEALAFYDDESKPKIEAIFYDCINKGNPFDENLTIYSGNGKKKYIRTKGEAIYKGESIVKIVGVFQDITKESEAEIKLKDYAADLEKKNSELDQFAYIVSHDLKAPLRGINNLTMWIEEDPLTQLSAESKVNFGLLKKRALRLENLINGVLAYTRAGRTITHEAHFSAYELIDEIVLSLDIPEFYTINIIQPLPFLKADRTKLEQVLLNLISNAIKHNNSANPLLQITASETESFYKFMIKDNGPGIEEAYHQKIFLVFQTLQSRDTFENTGVGLAISKKIVEEVGGNIWVESALGKGSIFCFTWPKLPIV